MSGGIGKLNRMHGGGGRGRQLGGSSVDPKDLKPVDRITVVRVAGFFRPYRGRVLVSILLIIATALIGLVNPLLLKALIDTAIPQKDWDKLLLFVGLMIALPIISGLIGVGQTYLNTIIGQRVMRDLRNALYIHLQRMPLRFFTSTRTGEIQSRLSNDVGGVQRVVTETATSVVSNLATAISTMIAMFLISWQLSLISIGLFPIFLLLTWKVGQTRREVTSTTQKSIADITAMTEETLSVSGILLTKAFGRQAYEIERFQAENDRLAALQVRQQMVGRWFFMIIGTFFAITPAFVYLVAGHNIIKGPNTISIGDIVAFTTLQSRLFFPLGALLNVQVEIQGAFALFDRIFEYLDLDVDIDDLPEAVQLKTEDVTGLVSYREVGFRYLDLPQGAVTVAPEGEPDAEPAPQKRPFELRGIDFTARPGELVALVGPSGSGKSTIAMLLPRFYEVTSGAIEIDGLDIRKATLASLGQVIGIVTQETYLFHATIRENIGYGKLGARQDEIEAAARAAAIHDRIMEMPDGYDTIVGERGYKLSGGEKQRVAIARVILKDPRILILDEATSALDSTSERLIQGALESLMAGRTTIAIAHRLSTILAADQILVIQRGEIVERGTHAELLALGGLYEDLYQHQFVDEQALRQAGAAGETDEEQEAARDAALGSLLRG